MMSKLPYPVVKAVVQRRLLCERACAGCDGREHIVARKVSERCPNSAEWEYAQYAIDWTGLVRRRVWNGQTENKEKEKEKEEKKEKEKEKEEETEEEEEEEEEREERKRREREREGRENAP